MNRSKQQHGYLFWAFGVLGFDEDMRRDFTEAHTGQRSLKEITYRETERLLAALKRELKKIGIAVTQKSDMKKNMPTAPARKPGEISRKQVDMVITIARRINMDHKTLYGFIKHRITDERTGDIYELTQKEMTHLKNALEHRAERGDKIREKPTVINKTDKIIQVNFG